MLAGLVAAFLSAAAAVPPAAIPVDRPVVRVLVQTEAASVVDSRMLSDIFRTAREIWQPYADVAFDLVGDGERSSQSLHLVITDRISAFSDGASLGWIEFVDGHPAKAITISATAAKALMRASRWGGLPKTVQRTFLVRAIARAIAHELGHYLLASRQHTARGLMRGQLTADDIMQARRSSVRLDSAQVEKLRNSVLFARRDDVEERVR